MIEGVCQRAVELEVPDLLVEFETLPEMTVRVEWGIEITRLLAETLRKFHDTHGLRTTLLTIESTGGKKEAVWRILVAAQEPKTEMLSSIVNRIKILES